MIRLPAASIGTGEPVHSGRRLVAVLVVVTLLSLAAAGAIAYERYGSTAPAAPRAAGSTGSAATAGGPGGTGGAPPARPPTLGVFAGPGAAGAAESLDQALGGTVRYAMDYLPWTTWTSITDPSWLAAAWSGSPFDMVLGVPMLPDAGASLAQGAAGAYDAEFTLLAQRLVAAGLGGAVLFVGWQPGDANTPWFVQSDAAASYYVAYWDRIAAAMSSVPGADFTFEWDPGNSGSSPVSPTSMYPGDGAVDIVGTDAFDVVPATVPKDQQWARIRDQAYGPAWAATFAAEHHKRLAVAMWGVVPTTAGGGGDSPDFVRSLLAWASGVGAAFSVLWDSGSSTLSGGAFPAAYAALVAAVGPTADAGSGGTAG